MASTIKAEIAPVSVGHLQIEGLMSEDGVFYVGVPQIVERFTVDTKQPTRYFRSLLGNGLTIDRMSISGTRITMNGILLTDFEKLIAKLDRAGNKSAQDFRDDLVGLSLHQLFSDAFGQKFEADDRQKWVKTRQETKRVRFTLTDAVQNYKDRHPELSDNDRHWLYNNASDLVNLTVFGRKAKRLIEDFGADRNKLRDWMTADELKWVAEVEDLAARLIENSDFHPCDAVKEAGRRLIIPTVDRRQIA